MQTPSQQTVEYHGSPPAAIEPGRVRVALVGSTRPGATDDLYSLLRRRLLALSTFVAATHAVVYLAMLIKGPDPEIAALLTESDILFSHIRWLGLLGVNLSAIGVLWQRPPKSLFGLRVIEVVIVSPLMANMLFSSVSYLAYEPLEQAAHEPLAFSQALIGRYTSAGSYLWFLVITIYGTFIPNTLRRATFVSGLIAISPIALFLVYALLLKPLDPAITAQVVFELSMTNAIAFAIALFATSRIEVLRQQATEARKLGQYVLKEKLGAGGMGEVYRAEHVLLRRPCAIKTIRAEQAGDPDTLRRFEREVQITATLTHPNTVQVFDYGHASDGTFYYVMEYLPGLTLDEVVRRGGPLTPRRAVHFLRQVCAALGEAHALGLTHRDIKPGNVMVCERGGVFDVAKVLDFGLVRIPKEDADGGTLTREGVIAGTPA